MKRGRPSKRKIIQKMVLEVLEESKLPLTILTITKKVSKKMGKKVSWNTVAKYTKELVEVGKVKPIVLPHSKKEGKQGLTIYTVSKKN